MSVAEIAAAEGEAKPLFAAPCSNTDEVREESRSSTRP